MSFVLSAYDGIWNAALALRVPQMVLRGRREELRERLGECPRGGEPPPIWIHAASVGEMTAAAGLLRGLGNPEGVRIAVSAMTRTGKERARSLRPDVGPMHFPLDAGAPVRRFLDRLRPASHVSLETEIWPTVARELAVRDVPWGIASGRISARARRRALRVRGLFRQTLGTVRAVAARSERDAQRFVELGASAEAVRVTGDLKRDRPVAPREPAPDDPPRWIAACTRPGEERDLVEILRRLEGRISGGELILAPRHPERFEEVATLVLESGLALRRWDDRGGKAPGGSGWSVLLVDRMGVLDEAYRLARFSFVGGSLHPHGGHSPLESAEAGRGVLVGPHTESCEDDVEALIRDGGAVRVVDRDSLGHAVERLLTSPEEAEALGTRAHRHLAASSGVAAATVEFLRARGVLP